MHYFKRILTLAVLATILLPLAANATITRLIGLGGEHVNTIVKDQANYIIWPQLVKNYGTVANAEFAGAPAMDLKSVSANYDWGEEKGVVNFALNKIQNTNYTQMFDAAGDGPGVNNALTLRYGRKLGGDNLGGLALYYGYESYEKKESPKLERSASVIGLQAGYSLTEQNVDLSLGFETASFTNDSDGTSLTEANGMSSIMFAGRWFWDYSEKSALVPNLSFSTTSDNAKAGTAEVNITSTKIKLGAGHNWWPADNALVIFDFGIEMNSTETEAGGSKSTDSDNYMPYWRVGAETKIFDWMDGRVGAERFWHSMMTGGDTPAEVTEGAAHTHTYVGASVHWNRLLLDLLVEPRFFQDGPYFISGSGGDLFSRVSMKYNFKK